jgi:hypothetical protein
MNYFRSLLFTIFFILVTALDYILAQSFPQFPPGFGGGGRGGVKKNKLSSRKLSIGFTMLGQHLQFKRGKFVLRMAAVPAATSDPNSLVSPFQQSHKTTEAVPLTLKDSEIKVRFIRFDRSHSAK